MHQDRARHDCGHYRKALGKLHDPVWPDKTLEELLRTAFRGRIIEREEQRGRSTWGGPHDRLRGL